jgi:hypothetical protein
VKIRPGDVFSREKLNESTKAITDKLGAQGYAFANVNAAPELDKEKRQVAFTIFVDPGKRTYVRRDQHHRQLPRRATRSFGRRCARWKAPGTTPSGSSFARADRSHRLLQRGQRRNAAGAGNHRPGGRECQRWPRNRPATSRSVLATRVPRKWSSRDRSRSPTSSAAASIPGPAGQHRQAEPHARESTIPIRISRLTGSARASTCITASSTRLRWAMRSSPSRPAAASASVFRSTRRRR